MEARAGEPDAKEGPWDCPALLFQSRDTRVSRGCTR
jgi:hypothetical protein